MFSRLSQIEFDQKLISYACLFSFGLSDKEAEKHLKSSKIDTKIR